MISKENGVFLVFLLKVGNFGWDNYSLDGLLMAVNSYTIYYYILSLRRQILTTPVFKSGARDVLHETFGIAVGVFTASIAA